MLVVADAACPEPVAPALPTLPSCIGALIGKVLGGAADPVVPVETGPEPVGPALPTVPTWMGALMGSVLGAADEEPGVPLAMGPLITEPLPAGPVVTGALEPECPLDVTMGVLPGIEAVEPTEDGIRPATPPAL